MSEPIKIEPYQAKQIVDYLYARAREAEARVAELEKGQAKWPPSWEKAPGWALEVCDFLKEVLAPIPMPDASSASRLLTDAIALGIIPEPDCSPGCRKTIIVHTLDEAEAAASFIDYPIKVRTAFGLAAPGNGVAWNLAALQTLVARALDVSMVSEVMLEGTPVVEPAKARPGDGCPCPPEVPYPGDPICICTKCGGRKV